MSSKPEERDDRSGGVDVNADYVDVGGDVVGRDKVEGGKIEVGNVGAEKTNGVARG